MASSRVTYFTIATGLAAGLLAGCGGSAGSAGSAARQSSAPAAAAQAGGSGSGSKPHSKVCDVLTQDQAAKIIGRPVKPTEMQTSDSCTYAAASGDFATVGLTVFGTPASASLINLYRSQYQGLTNYSGLGDAALSESDGRLVVAVKGTVGCVALRAGEVPGDPATSITRLAALCTQLFAAG